MEFTPAAASFTTAWPAAGVGSGTSSRVRASGPPGLWMRMAFMVTSRFEKSADLVHDLLAPRLDLLRADGLAGLEHPRLDLLRQLLRTLEEPGDLVKAVVEEREHGNGAELSLVQVLIHEVGVLVAEEHAELDIGIAFHQLEEHGHVVQGVPAPVLGDDHGLELLAQAGERRLVLRFDLDLREELHERLFVGAHLIQILLGGHPLREPLLREHLLSFGAAYRIAARSTVNFATSFSSASRTTRVTRLFGSMVSAGNAYTH